MARIETSLHQSYQSRWTVGQALREIISNALDGETRFAPEGRGKMTIEYDDGTQVLCVSNENVTVPTKALLMGASSSREDAKLIGQFGEGLPLALLVLSREFYTVEIENGEEKWKPEIGRSSTFSEPVLIINTRKIQARRDFTVTIQGVTLKEYQEARRQFICLDPLLHEDNTFRTSTGAVLVSRHHKGRIYHKGVFVQTRTDVLFGYDLPQMTMDRDRNIANFDTDALPTLLVQVIEEDSARARVLATHIVDALGDNSKYEDWASSWSSLNYCLPLRTALAQAVRERFGPNVVVLPKYNSSEQEAETVVLRSMGKVPVHCDGALLSLLQDLKQGKALLVEKNNTVVRTFAREELTREEIKVLSLAFLVCSKGEEVEVVEFENRESILVTDHKCLIPRSLLTDDELFLGRCFRNYALQGGNEYRVIIGLIDGTYAPEILLSILSMRKGT